MQLSNSDGSAPKCPQCGSTRNYRDGWRNSKEKSVQRWLCRNCGFRFSEKPLQKNPNWSLNSPTALRFNNQLCVLDKKAKKLDTATELKTVAGINTTQQGLIVEFQWKMKKHGLADVTIKNRT